MATITNHGSIGLSIAFNTQWPQVDESCTADAWNAFAHETLRIPIGRTVSCPDNFARVIADLGHWEDLEVEYGPFTPAATAPGVSHVADLEAGKSIDEVRANPLSPHQETNPHPAKTGDVAPTPEEEAVETTQTASDPVRTGEGDPRVADGSNADEDQAE